MFPFYDRVVSLSGTAFYIGMMSVGYYYNLTFVQLGLIDLGERLIGMSRTEVAASMAVLALLTCLLALGFGTLISRRGIGLVGKLRWAFVVILAQTIITPLAQELRTPGELLFWIAGCSLTLGIGVPVTFSLAVDLVPRGRRGIAAALITAAAYLAANTLPADWTIQEFTLRLMAVMPFGVLGLGLLAFLPFPFIKQLAAQHLSAQYAQGRYAPAANRRMIVLILLMFGVFFVDSLGFLRLLETPRFMDNAWQAVELQPRLFIGIVHALAALIGGILYDALDVRELFYWTFGIFALTHLMYTLTLRVSATSAPLAQPVLYATAVSLYTVINFALWADLSTPRTIGRNAALGVALSGWTATFLSTALAIWWETSGMPLMRHLNIVDALAMLFFLALVIQSLHPGRIKSSPGEKP